MLREEMRWDGKRENKKREIEKPREKKNGERGK